MTNGFDEMILNMTDTTPEPEDYTGEDGLLYCGKCHKPKEGYFPKETAAWLGRDRHPAECDCQRAEREEREAPAATTPAMSASGRPIPWYISLKTGSTRAVW